MKQVGMISFSSLQCLIKKMKKFFMNLSNLKSQAKIKQALVFLVLLFSLGCSQSVSCEQQKNFHNKNINQNNSSENDIQDDCHSEVYFKKITDSEVCEVDPVLLECDPGFSKWLLVFEKISGRPPYSLQQKRIAQHDKDNFAPYNCGFSETDILYFKLLNTPLKIFVSERGFLPGEEVLFRICSNKEDVYKEAAWTPRPLILKNDNNNIIIEGKLLNIEPTMYDLFLRPNTDAKYTFISTSATERLEAEFQGDQILNYMPGVIGLNGGESKIEIIFEDGSSYEMQIPWGDELFKYLKGSK